MSPWNKQLYYSPTTHVPSSFGLLFVSVFNSCRKTGPSSVLDLIHLCNSFVSSPFRLGLDPRLPFLRLWSPTPHPPSTPSPRGSIDLTEDLPRSHGGVLLVPSSSFKIPYSHKPYTPRDHRHRVGPLYGGPVGLYVRTFPDPTSVTNHQ